LSRFFFFLSSFIGMRIIVELVFFRRENFFLTRGEEEKENIEIQDLQIRRRLRLIYFRVFVVPRDGRFVPARVFRFVGGDRDDEIADERNFGFS